MDLWGLAYELRLLSIGQTDMTFDGLIEKKEEYITDPYETWGDSNRTAAWVEEEEYSLDVLLWYLALIIRSL